MLITKIQKSKEYYLHRGGGNFMANDFKKFLLKMFNLRFSNLKKKNVDPELPNLIISGCRPIPTKIRITFSC